MPNGNEIPGDLLGMAGEYAVAHELCRRGLAAHMAVVNQKKLDILASKPDRTTVAKVEVKAKQKRSWPKVKGIAPSEKSTFLVFVDYTRRPLEQRPTFYVMSQPEWRPFVEQREAVGIENGTITLDADDIVLQNNGKFRGSVIMTEHLDCSQFRERWDKIIDFVNAERIWTRWFDARWERIWTTRWFDARWGEIDH